jgi:hypothetical protein
MNSKPIFLISLPRSGSTFLQKILMSHPDIASTAEPWFLLPLCHMRNKQGVFSYYGHPQSVNAFKRIEKDCGEDFIDSRIAEFATSIYPEYAQNNERYFLDKTPRYYHILDDLIRIFPDAKFIVLIRNPVSVFASSITGLRSDSVRRLDHLDRDLSQGPEKIAHFVEKHPNKVHLVRYEDLVVKTDNSIKDICKYLEIGYSRDMVDCSFSVQLKGHGDHLGARNHKHIVNTQDKWKAVINTPYRKARTKRLIQGYSSSYLKLGEYDRSLLIDELNAHKAIRMNLAEYLYAVEELVVRACKWILGERYGL